MRGVPCDMDAVTDIAKENGLMVIEDVAQAAGGTYKGKYLGTIGDVGCFSFQYHKIITAGEGGIVVTNDERLYDRCMGYHDTAACWRPDRFAEQRYEGELFCGVNYRMSELTGAVMLAQLDRDIRYGNPRFALGGFFIQYFLKGSAARRDDSQQRSGQERHQR